MMTSEQQEFDPTMYPNLKPTKPRNKSLRTCTVCRKPGYMYLLSGKTTDSIVIYYAHYNEPPIGLTILRGKPIGFRYRRCFRDGKTYNSLEEAIEADQNIPKPVFVPKHKSLTICTTCNKPDYMYKTYFQHYNEPPVGKIILRGRVIGDKYRRCYLAKGKVKQEQDLVKHKAKPGRIDREKFPKLTQVRTRARNIECPSCRRNGVLNVASNKSNPEKTTFYVRHEKLGGTSGKNKVDRRCYIGKLTEHVEYTSL